MSSFQEREWPEAMYWKIALLAKQKNRVIAQQYVVLLKNKQHTIYFPGFIRYD